MYKNFINNWLIVLAVLRKLREKETAVHDRKMLDNLATSMLKLAGVVHMLLVVDVLRVVKDTSLFCL